MTKRIARPVGVLVGVLALLLATTIWEPHDASVRARWFEGTAFLLSVFLIWHGSR